MSSLSSVGSSLKVPSSSAASVAGLSTNGINFTGLSSGLDTNSLIQGITAFDQAQITQLKTNQTGIANKETAVKTVEADLLDFQLKAEGLARSVGSVFDAKSVTSNNQSAATATASSQAAPAVYQFHVNTLAKAEQRASQGYASATAPVGTGQVQIQVGSGATTTVNVDSTNDTLQGLADAINNAGGGVNASIYNDGSGANAYHLLLTAKDTGAANAIAVTNSLSGGAAPDLSNVVQAASDATISIGGTKPISIHSASNTVTGAIQGVTINLLQANADVSLTVATDTTKSTAAVNDFVTSYNTLQDYITTNSSYDAKTNVGGVLLGDSTVAALRSQLARSVSGVVPGVNPKANTLSAIGVSLDGTGHLAVDNTKLAQALGGQLTGVSTTDVKNLFAVNGTSSNPAVQFVSGTAKTQAAGITVGVNVTRPATRASVAAPTPLALDANGVAQVTAANNQLTLTANGQLANLTLTPGQYTAQQLVQSLQGQVGGNSTLQNLGVVVGLDSANRLTITNGPYGSTSSLSVVGGSAVSSGLLGFTAGQSAAGVDVEGNFGGEAATGTGQFLTGDVGNPTTEGLKVRVSLTGTQLPTNPVASLTVSRGLASALDATIQGFLNPTSGRFALETQALDVQHTDIQKSIDTQTTALTAKQQSLTLEFATLEATLSKLKTTGDFLTAQTASLTTTKA